MHCLLMYPNRTVVQFKVRGLGWTGPMVQFKVQRGRKISKHVRTGFRPNRTETSVRHMVLPMCHVFISVEPSHGLCKSCFHPRLPLPLLYITANITILNLYKSLPSIPTEDDNSPAEETTIPGCIQLPTPEHVLPLSHHQPIETNNTMPQSMEEMLPTDTENMPLTRTGAVMPPSLDYSVVLAHC
jgi:hypothetical protein